MNEKFNTILSIVLIPQIVSLIVDTKMWHYSALTLYMMWKHERKTNELLFSEEL